MWARLETHDKERLNDVTELIDFDPEGMFHPDLIWKKVPDWMAPYIDYSYWWDEATQTFQDDSGYANLLKLAKKRQYGLFDAAFGVLDYKRNRSSALITEMMALGEAAPAEDTNILGQLNMVAEENRIIQKEIEEVFVPSPATDAAMESMLQYLSTIRPWLPWEVEKNKPMRKV